MCENNASQPDNNADRDQQLEAVIADYIRAGESGKAPNQREILERHPDLADELRQFFAQHDRMNQIAAPIRGFGDAPAPAVGPGHQLSYVGNYELLEEIARGGMGVVYKARQTTLGRIVAVKMIISGRLASEQDVQRFQVEAQAAAGLQHPNIVSIHEVGQHEGWHYFSMDYVQGRDLSKILRENLLSAKQAATYVRQMAEAIHYAHQRGTLHRDLKSSNILIDSHDQVRITDFGLAMRVEGGSDLTRTGQIVGTPSYMPPEQAQGKRSLIGPGSDVYSMGAVLYECLTGRAPFRADSVLKTIEQVIHAEAASPRTLNAAIPRDLETICLKCLEKEPHRRYGTAQLLADDLGRFLTGEPIVARPARALERTVKWVRRHPTPAALIVSSAVALLAMIGAGIGLYYNTRLDIANRDLFKTKVTLELSNSQLGIAKEELEVAVKEAREERARARRYLYVSQMTLAERANQEGDIGRVIQLLRSLIPERVEQEDLRGFEWHHLWRLHNGEKSRLQGHSEAVTAIAFSPDDKHLASASADKTVKLWNVLTGKEVRSLLGHTARVTSLRYSRDGNLLVSGGVDMKVILWNPSTGEPLYTLQGHEGPVTSVAFSPDGKRIVSGSEDNTVRVWDVDNSYNSIQLAGHRNPVSSIAISPDGKKVAGVSHGGTATAPIGQAIVWDSDSGKVLSKVGENGRATSWTAVRFSPDGEMLATAGYSGNFVIQLWEADSNRIKHTLNGHENVILSLDFSSDGQRLVTSSADHTIKVWNVVSGELLHTFHEEAAVLDAAFSPDGVRIASGSEDRSIKMWSPPGQEARSILQRDRQVNNVVFSPDGRLIGAAAYVWDSRTGKEITNKLPESHLQRIAFSPDSLRVAVGNKIVVVSSGKVDAIENTEKGMDRLSGIGTTFSRDGKLLAAVADLNTVRVWDIPSGQLLKSLLVQERTPRQLYFPCCVDFSKDSRWLAVGSLTARFSLPGTLQIWDVADAKVFRTLEGFRDDVLCVAFSPDGLYMAAGIGEPRGVTSTPGEVRIWNTKTWQLEKLLPNHRGCVLAISFSQDGKRIAVASGYSFKKRNEGGIKIWDLFTGLEVASLLGESSPMFGVAFSPCGRRLATAGRDGSVRIFDGTPIMDDP